MNTYLFCFHQQNIQYKLHSGSTSCRIIDEIVNYKQNLFFSQSKESKTSSLNTKGFFFSKYAYKVVKICAVRTYLPG